MKLRGIPMEDWSLSALSASADDSARLQYRHIATLLYRQAVHQPDVSAHAERVGSMAERITRVLGGTEPQAGNMYTAGIVHDLGKLNHAALVDKKGPLTPPETLMMNRHAQDGAGMLMEVPGSVTRFMASVALMHHKNVDGGVYPIYADRQIPLAARIVAAADRWDALRSDRSYKKAFSVEKSLEIVTEQWKISAADQALDNRILAALTYIVTLDHSDILDAEASAGRGRGTRQWFTEAVQHEKLAAYPLGIDRLTQRKSSLRC